MQAIFRPGVIAGIGLVVALPFAALASDEMRVGIAASVKDQVTGAATDGAPHPLVIGEDLFFNERIVTTTSSSAVVEFRDRSTLEVGPNATIILDKSIYNPVESVSEKTITVVAGAFRFVSGVAAQKSETDIQTPVGTLGIRGSIIVGQVAAQGDVALFPVQGQPTWTTASGTVVVPEGGGLLATFRNKQFLTVPQVPPSFAGLVRGIAGQLGGTTPALTGFSPTQQHQNGNDHTVPSGQQGQGQGGNSGPVNPLGGNGPSEIFSFFSSFKGGQTGTGGPGDGDFIAGFFAGQKGQHDANAGNGATGVTEELSFTLNPNAVIHIAANFAAQNPSFATQIALGLVHLYPSQVQGIINALGAVLPKSVMQGVITAINKATGGNFGYNGPSPVAPPTPPANPSGSPY